MEGDLVQTMGLEDNAILLEPREVFDKGILGVTEDKCHVV